MSNQARNDVHLRIDLDSNKAKSAMDALKASALDTRKQLEQMRASGKYADDAPEIKAMEARLKGLTAVLAETKQSFTDISEAVENMAEQSVRGLDSLQRQLVARAKSLTGSADDARQLAEYREQYERLRQESVSRDVKRRDFATAANDLYDQTPEQVARLVDQAKSVIPTLREGTDELRQTFSYYQQFRERMEEQQGTMTLTSAQQMARGNQMGTLNELQNASKYLREYREEWGRFMDESERNTMTDDLDAVNERVLTLARNIATGVTPASFTDMQQALTVIKTSMEQLDPAIDGNKTLINQLKGEYDQLRQSVAEWNTVQLDEQQQAQMMADAQSVLDQGRKAEVKDIRASIEALKLLDKQQGVTAAQHKKYADMIGALEGRMKGSTTAAEQMAEENEHIARTLSRLNSAPLDDLTRAMKILEDRMQHAERNTKEYIDTVNKIRNVRAQIDHVNEGFKNQQGFVEQLKSKFGSYLGMFAGLYAGGQAVRSFFDKNLSYSDALADIQKTTGLTGDSLAELANRIKQVDTRTTIEDMDALAYSAGRLGVQGVDNVLAFTKAANMLTVALGDELGGAEAVESLMKISDLMGATQTEGLEKALLNTGSAINEVTQASTAAAGPIVDFMSRVASVGKMTGMSTADLVGLGSAIDSLGQNVEASASSIQKLLVAISTNATGVAQSLKMSATETQAFITDVANGRMTDAFLKVLQKANEMGDLASLKGAMGDLGGDGVRTLQTLTSLAGAYDKVNEMILLSNQAYADGTSVINEYNVKNEDAAALWERLKNSFQKMIVSPDNVKWIEDFLRRLQDLPDAVGKVVSSLSWLGTAAEVVLMAFTKLTPVVSAFIYTLVARTVINFAVSMGQLAQSLGVAVAALYRATTGAQAFGAAMRQAGKAVMTNGLAALVGILTSVVMAFREAKQEASQFTQQLHSDFDRAMRDAQRESEAIDQMTTKLYEANEATGERASVIKQLNTQYGDYLGYLFDEKMSNDEIAASLRAVNAQLRMKALLQAKANSEEQIRSMFSGERGEQLDSLVTQVQSRLIGASDGKGGKLDENAAYDKALSIVGQMEESLSSLLIEVKDASGNVTGYRTPQVHQSAYLGQESGEVDLRNRMMASMQKLFADNGVVINEGIYGLLAQQLREYKNVDARMQGRIRQSDQIYDRDLRQIAGEEYEIVGGKALDTWQKIESAVTQNGQITERATEEQAVLYLNYNKDLQQKQRDELQTDLKAFAQFAARTMVDLQQQGKTDTDEYRQMESRAANASSLYRIIEQSNADRKLYTPTPDDKKQDRLNQIEVSDARAAEKEIVDLIKQQFTANEAELKRKLRDRLLSEDDYNRAIEENTIELNRTLRAARLRMVDEIDQATYQKQTSGVAGLADKGDIAHIGATYRSKRKDGAAAIANIRAEAEENGNIIEEALARKFRQIESMLLEQDLIGKVNRKYQSEFFNLGLLIDQVDAEMRGKLMGSMLKVGKEAFRFDVNSDDGLSSFRTYLERYGDLKEQLDALSKQNAGDAEKQAQVMESTVKAIYYKAYEYANQYDDAERRAAAENKKRVDWNWSKDTDNLSNQAAQDRNKQQQTQLRGMSAVGFDTKSLEHDMVVEQYRLRLEAAAKYYDYLKAHGGTEQQLADAQRSVTDAQQQYTQSVLDGLSEKFELLKQYGDVLTQFGSGIGEAMVSESKTVQEAVGEMINSFMRLTVEYAEQELQRWITKQMYAHMSQELDEETNGTDGGKTPEAAAAEEAQRQVLDVTKKGFMRLFSFKRGKKREEVAIEQNAQESILDVTETAGTVREQLTGKIEQGITNTLASSAAENVATNLASTQATIQTDASGAAAETAIGIASGSAKTIGQLGWWGIPLIAVISAALGALLNAAMDAVGSAFGGGGKKASAPTAKTKLVSGMLTYDSGNAQSFPVMGDDGRVYMASRGGVPASGTGMVTQPTLTTVGGVPALVAERGPEMVIGRETTHAMMMSRPDLIRQIVEFDRNRSRGFAKTFDEGNLDAVGSEQLAMGNAAEPAGGISNDTAVALVQAIALLSEQLSQPITAKLDMNGKGGGTDQIARGMLNSLRVGDLDSVRRLFGNKR